MQVNLVTCDLCCQVEPECSSGSWLQNHAHLHTDTHTHTHTHTRARACTRACMQTHIYTRTHIHTHTNMGVHANTHLHTHTHTYTHTHTHTLTYTYMYTCTHTCSHTHTHTHIHTQTDTSSYRGFLPDPVSNVENPEFIGWLWCLLVPVAYHNLRHVRLQESSINKDLQPPWYACCSVVVPVGNSGHLVTISYANEQIHSKSKQEEQMLKRFMLTILSGLLKSHIPYIINHRKGWIFTLNCASTY